MLKSLLPDIWAIVTIEATDSGSECLFFLQAWGGPPSSNINGYAPSDCQQSILHIQVSLEYIEPDVPIHGLTDTIPYLEDGDG